MENTTRKKQRILPILLPDLPDEIIRYIQSMLHVKSICRFRCVCKQWYKLFKHPDFIKSRLEHSIGTEKLYCFSIQDSVGNGVDMNITNLSSVSVFENNYNVLRDYYSVYFAYVEADFTFKYTHRYIDIVCSCDDLFLMESSEPLWKRSHWLSNRYTNECKKIVMPELKYNPWHNPDIRSSVTYGIGYNINAGDYTIVVASCYGFEGGCCYGTEIQYYSLKSQSWRKLTNMVPYIITSTCGETELQAEVIFVGGAFHWMARRFPTPTRCIISFDTCSGNFNEVPVTPPFDILLNENDISSYNHDSRLKSLCVLGGCLGIIRPHSGYNFEVWVMKEYNVAESWTKLFDARIPEIPNRIYNMKLLWEYKNGEVLFAAPGGIYAHNCRLILYDPLSKECKVVDVDHRSYHRWNIVAYPERPVSSLNSRGTGTST